MKKLNVNKDICIGCGACVAIDPEHFDFDDNGYSDVISNENVESENAMNAISSCPVQAISLKKECNCENGGECDCGDDCHCEHCNCEK